MEKIYHVDYIKLVAKLTIDELRWIILISTLSNFNFYLEFVVKDIINKPDGKWSKELVLCCEKRSINYINYFINVNILISFVFICNSILCSY